MTDHVEVVEMFPNYKSTLYGQPQTYSTVIFHEEFHKQ